MCSFRSAFVIENDPVQNELACLELFRNKKESFSETDRREWIPQILRAVHLPVVGQKYNLFDYRNYGEPKKPYFCHPVLDFIVGHSQNIPRLGDLLSEAVNDNTCEWHLERFCNSALLQLCKWRLRCDFQETGELPNAFCIQNSKEVLIKGFRIAIYATPPSFGDRGKQYGVESRDDVRFSREVEGGPRSKHTRTESLTNTLWMICTSTLWMTTRHFTLE